MDYGKRGEREMELDSTNEINLSQQTEGVLQITDADVFQLYGRLVNPMKELENACERQQKQEEAIAEAKETIGVCFITPFIYAIGWTVAFAIPFLIVFWVAGNLVKLEDGVKFASAYINWYEDLPISNMMVGWGTSIDSLLLKFIFLILLGFVEFLLMPNVIVLLPIMFVVGVLVTIIGVIRAKCVIKSGKEELVELNQQIPIMIEQLSGPLSFVPLDYRYSEAIEYFFRSFCNQKAETLKEAVILYDNYVHQKKMESAQEFLVQQQILALKEIEYQNIQLNNIHSKLSDIDSRLFWNL